MLMAQQPRESPPDPVSDTVLIQQLQTLLNAAGLLGSRKTERISAVLQLMLKLLETDARMTVRMAFYQLTTLYLLLT